MAKNPCVVSLAMILVLAGCQALPRASHAKPPPPNTPAKVCNGASCDVSVTVAGNCVVSVDPPILDVRQGPQNQVFHWDIKTPGYHFSSTTAKPAIEIVDPPNTNGQFTPSPPAATRLNAQFKRRPGTPAPIYHTYLLNVVRESDNQVCTTPDPWVWE